MATFLTVDRIKWLATFSWFGHELRWQTLPLVAPLERQSGMSLQELENSIAKLPPDELSKFRKWFMDFDAEQFDKRIESDASDGRLDSLANTAICEHAAGKSTTL